MILNIYKPKGWTSFDVVRKVKIITKQRKVGHAGTLDPFAEGVLVLGTGRDTKKLTSISRTDKEYEAILKLGAKTDTFDLDGKVIEKKKVPELQENMINKVLTSCLGEQLQTPPMFSAKKINGQRLYKLARKNIEVERKQCLINIYAIELMEFNAPLLTIRVKCSKGTYIRVLGNDIAEKLGTVGHLVALKRIRVGNYDLEQTQQLKELEKNGCNNIA